MNHIKVKVFPNSKEEKVIKKSTNSFEVSVREKAEEGKANEALKRIISDFLNIDSSKLKLVKGGKKRNKIFKIR